MTSWRTWHDQYADPLSSLSRRLQVVQQRLDEVLAGGVVRRVVSLCAGDGRDVIPVLARLPRARQPEVTLVELDADLAAAAAESAAGAGVHATVVVGDAGDPQTWQPLPPVDVLMLCGVFGNVTDDDVRTTIRAAPALLSPGGVVIWTRGSSGDPDPRPQVRRWFGEAGFSELSFDAEPTGYGVGVVRRPAVVRGVAVPRRLFSFVR